MSAAAAVEAVWGLPQDMPKHEGQQACKQTGLSNSFSSKQKLIEVFKEAATVTSNVLSFETVAWLLVGHLTLMCVSTAPCCLPQKRDKKKRFAHQHVYAANPPGSTSESTCAIPQCTVGGSYRVYQCSTPTLHCLQ